MRSAPTNFFICTLMGIIMSLGCNSPQRGKSVLAKNQSIVTDTFEITGKRFTLLQGNPESENNMHLHIVSSKGDTIYVHPKYSTNGFKLIDFDENGNVDVRLHYLTNIGGVSDLVVYNCERGSFVEIQDFDQYPSPKKVEGTRYWYTYHKSGCADLNWGSELFKIEDYKAIEMGDIRGIGCEGEERNGIFIYKVNGSERIEVEYIRMEPGYYPDKRDFIEAYWENNYAIFE